MALSRKDRFNLKTQLLEGLGSPEWDSVRINVLLQEFGLQPFTGQFSDPSLSEIIAGVSDENLTELYALVMGVDADSVADVAESAASDGTWKPNYARVFLSHSAAHKQFVGEVADELALVGIHGFVAHDTMAFSKPWQSQIEQALRSMQAFVAIIHPEFNPSAWCHQEVGWARGRRVPYYAVRYGADPAGFIGRDQWPSATDQTPKQVASIISGWVASVPTLGKPIVDGLFESLRGAPSFIDAGTAAKRIASMGTLTEDQWKRLDTVFWSNDQVYGGGLARKVLQPFYSDHQRQFPPTKPSLQSDQALNPLN
jgi:hypothetical protein